MSWAAALMVLGLAAALPRKRQVVPALVGWVLVAVIPASMLVWRTGDPKLGKTFLGLALVLAAFLLVWAPIRARLLGFGSPEDEAQQAELERRRAAARRNASKGR